MWKRNHVNSYENFIRYEAFYEKGKIRVISGETLDPAERESMLNQRDIYSFFSSGITLRLYSANAVAKCFKFLTVSNSPHVISGSAFRCLAFFLSFFNSCFLK